MTKYTANDLEREVLDPVFYRYEKAIRAQVRLERQLADATRSLSTDALKVACLNTRIERLVLDAHTAEVKLTRLCAAAKGVLSAFRGPALKTKREIASASASTERWLKELDAAARDARLVEVPF